MGLVRELELTYGTLTIGGSTARQIDGHPREEWDYPTGWYEVEFITTAATEAAFTTELNTVRDAFRVPRQDLVVKMGSQTILSRKHSDNTGLNTSPRITKDGDPADTALSRHFRVRIEYELPADNVSTNFRRGATVTISFSAARRRSVTIVGTYTANSTDGTTTASAQYLAQIEAAQTSLLNLVDSSVAWERVGQPQVEFFETNKICQFTRTYREVNVNQSLGGVDEADIIDPKLDISVMMEAPGDSFEAGLSFTGGGGTTWSGGLNGSSTGVDDPTAPPTGTVAMGTIARPIQITAIYNAEIAFPVTALKAKLEGVIRPWMLDRMKAVNPSGAVVVLEETPAYEIYENHIRASMKGQSYSSTIIRRTVSYRVNTMDGYTELPTTGPDKFSFYEFSGPAIRRMTVQEDREELVGSSQSAKQLTQDLKGTPGEFASGFQDWRRISHDPQAEVKTLGTNTGSKQNVAFIKIVSEFQYRKKKTASVMNAGGITGAQLT